MNTRKATIGSKVGLHARPAAVFCEAVENSGAEVTIEFDGETVDADSVLEVMTLGAMHGDEVTLASDNEEVLEELVKLLESDLEA